MEGRLDVIALTDHDTVAGVAEAMERARNEPIDVLAGIEVSCTWQESEIHVLGYGIDPTATQMSELEVRAGARRTERMQGMIERLQDQGLEITLEQVRATAASERTTLARPHLARALEREGYVDEASEAFDRYIGNEHPAYIPTRLMSVDRAIEVIHAAGGLSVWAHPPAGFLDKLLPVLVEAGLDGLEVHRPRTPQWKVRRLLALAREYDLLVTGGSDWHGPDHGPMGEFRVSASQISPFLEAVGVGADPESPKG